MPTYVRLAAKEEVRLQNLDKSKTKRKIISRLGKIWLYIIGESITWFVGLFISSITPYLMIPGATGFLATSYSTLLLMAFNIFNFLGSLVGKWWASAKVGCPVRTRAALPLRLRSTCRFLFVVGRLGFCFIYVVYVCGGRCGLGWWWHTCLHWLTCVGAGAGTLASVAGEVPPPRDLSSCLARSSWRRCPTVSSL